MLFGVFVSGPIFDTPVPLVPESQINQMKPDMSEVLSSVTARTGLSWWVSTIQVDEVLILFFYTGI